MELEDRGAWQRRIATAMHTLVKPAMHPLRVPLEVAAHHVHGEPVDAATAMAATFVPFSVGDRWGGRWDTTWFRMRGTVPDEWAGEEVVALIHLGGDGMVSFSAEGQIWVDGVPVQGLHHAHREYRITDRACGAEPVELYVEAAANPVPPWAVADWPSWAPDYDGQPLYALAQSELAVVDRMVEALWWDMRVLTQLADQVRDEPRNTRVQRALLAAVACLDRRDVRGTAAAARAELQGVLGARATNGHRVTAVGHAHIDTAWLWPVRETKRKCARSFSNQLRLMDDYPEHHFACSQAQQYAWMKEGYPAVWEQIRRRVKDGRWEPVGGMWVEPDTNLPSGESLVRQVVYGKRFFLDELGVETHELWIPDVFGYSAALPQIARQAGIRALVTQKLSWNSVNQFPHHTFWWEGNDGSRLLTHFPPAATYNGNWDVAELLGSVRSFSDHGRSDRSLYPFGYGDGGGGPTRQMLELGRRLADLDGLPPIEIGAVSGFLEAVEAEAADLAVWVGELYLEFHRGTYTTHADVKRGNRRGEEALRAAEMWATAAAALAGGTYPAADLERAWKLLLTNQFHDIIPGSSITWVYEDAARDHAEVLSTADAVIDAAQALLAGPPDGHVVFNAASHPRREVIQLPGPRLAVVDAPACGWASVVEAPPPLPVSVTTTCLENHLLRVEWDPDGLLTSVWDKEHGREVLAAGERGNLFQIHEDRPQAFDAWDIDIAYLQTVSELVALERVEIAESDPLRGAVRFVRSFGDSSISQVMRLAAGSRRLDFVTDVDWQERHRLLKVAFPVAIRASQATYEIQHGHIERPTVWNTSWDVARFEVCAHRWADLGESGYGVALLNDSKYGYDIHGHVMRLSLLRGPGYPDPEADRGRHHFCYALFPHAGDIQRGGVREEAEAFNLPLRIVPGSSGLAPHSVVTVDRPGVSVEAVKWADGEEAVIVRLCEVWGGRGPATVRLGFPAQRASRTDLLERETEPLELNGDTVTIQLHPFELVTLKLSVGR